MTIASFRMHPVPAAFVAGFAIVIAVNATMIWLAIGSFSGLYSDHARERGVHYNAIVADQRARDALGWHVDASWRADAGLLQIVLIGRDGRPVPDAAVTVDLVRPAEKRPPISLALERVDEGRFARHVDLPERGNWDADILVEAAGHRFAITKRMFLR
ncbi:MAG TPA: FixH family protein [Reyranella sp.]|nr:FixH family protein [Reyranella sp.]